MGESDGRWSADGCPGSSLAGQELWDEASMELGLGERAGEKCEKM